LLRSLPVSRPPGKPDWYRPGLGELFVEKLVVDSALGVFVSAHSERAVQVPERQIFPALFVAHFKKRTGHNGFLSAGPTWFPVIIIGVVSLEL